MTIDERLEALTQNLELLATMHRDSELRLEKIESLMDRMVEVSETLTKIAGNHD